MAKLAAASGRSAEELKSELRRLVRAITDDGDGRIETLRDAARALEALTDLRLSRPAGKPAAADKSKSAAKRPSPLSPQKPPSPPQQQPQRRAEEPEIPDSFVCPISAEIMKDPVVLATGETYDRPFIEEWLNSGKRTCPKTQQVISDLKLIPNKALRLVISNWCADNGVALPPLGDGSIVTKNDRNRLDGLLRTISAGPTADKKQAVGELRYLTKLHSSYRAMLGESSDAIPKLISLLSEPELDGDTQLREDTVTTILNLSIHDSNKKLVAEIPRVIPFLIDSLKAGTMEGRRNAAAALFSLSALDSNKTKIGELGAIRPLLDLLELGNPAAKRDAASAVFNLCMSHDNRARAVREGAIEVLLKCIADQSLVDESLAVLAMLSSDQEAVEEVGDCNGVECLLHVIRDSTCGRARENAVVVLYSVCMSDRTKLREVHKEESLNGTISQLSQSGTSRARRKAAGILDRLRRTSHNTHYSC